MSIGYAFWTWVLRHPGFVRRAGRLWQRWPGLIQKLPVLARHAELNAALKREHCFTNASHQPQLIAGDFLIGMPRSKRYACDHAMMLAMLPKPAGVKQACIDEAQRRARLCNLKLARGESFDLIDDYLMWIALSAVEPVLGGAAPRMLSQGGEANDADRMAYMLELRHVAAHLVIGGSAPPPILARAQAAARSLQMRVARGRDWLSPELRLYWAAQDPEAVVRNLLGLSWVGHPVTVQSGALVLRELYKRPDEWAALCTRVRAEGANAWHHTALRDELRQDILECMRFSPVFSMLSRQLPRSTDVQAGPRHTHRLDAGSKLLLVTQAALFDPDIRLANPGAPDPKSFCPARFSTTPDKANQDGMALMFGGGARECPGREVALEALVSAFIGLAQMQALAFERWPSYRWAEYDDGPMIKHVRLKPS